MKRNLPVSGFMTHHISTLSPSNNLEQVRQLFEKHGFHHAPVVEDGKLVGIVSYTDYLRIISDFFSGPQASQSSEKMLHSMLVKDIMTANPVSLRPDDILETALQVFRKNPFHALPVAAADGKLVGILTTYDVMKVMEEAISPEFSYTE